MSGFPSLTPGPWTPDGSPATIDAGSGYKAFPSLCRLDASRVLLAYYDGADHVDDASVVKGRIGTLATGNGSVSSWGSAFTIYDPASDGFRTADGLSVIDGKAVIAGCLFDGSVNHSPRVLVARGTARSLTSSTVWDVYAVTFAEGDDENLMSGRVLKVGDTYVAGALGFSAGTATSYALLNDSLTDWSAPTIVTIGSSGSLSEVQMDRLDGRRILALLRRETGTSTYSALSTDGGATFSAPASAHDGHGFPTYRKLTDQTLLWVSRASQFGDNAWRVSANKGTSWGSKTTLDTTGDLGEYTSLLQLTTTKTLCVYSVEMSGTDADLYSQVFTRA